MERIKISLCDMCTRKEPVDYNDPFTEKCEAYPAGIPAELLAGGDHRDGRPDDNGLRFDLRPGCEDYLQQWIIQEA